MKNKQQHYKNQAETIIKNLEKRHMAGSYFPSAKEAGDFLMSEIKEGSSVGVGGTQTLEEMGIKEALPKREDLTLYLRKPNQTYADMEELYIKSFSADYYLMSTNAITLNGELFNIDGLGNRTAALIYGPKKVFVVCGINKVCPDLDSAISRARNTAAPENCIRLEKNTPCSKTGKCIDCMSEDTICSQFVYTRHSAIPGRIHVILIGESLGY
ncbi:MAG: lactate utilization protein [Eubacterium sp.]|nr:lactate utilization protein [Eubacterium sp.]